MNASRLGIPISFYEETLHSAGVYGSTIFPHGVGLGATWNARLIYDVGRAVAEECSALGVDRTLSPVCASCNPVQDEHPLSEWFS